MYYAMDVAIGKTTNTLWLYSATGDSQRLNDRSKGIDNLLVGIKDPDYPYFGNVATPQKADDITDCKDTSNDRTGAKCPENKDRGWYIKLKDYAKASSEPTVNNGVVYFPVYRPSKSANKCDLGDAFICAADDECGTHTDYIGLESSKAEQKGSVCRFVGKGVLSKIVIFAGKLFANISGKSLGKVTDLVTVDAATGDVQTYRTSWRENF
jgi:type IV pilus assembly protein PilY1